MKARVKILLLSVSTNFNDFFIDIREINTLSVKVIYYINNIKLKSIDSIKTLYFLLRIFFFKDNIKETFKTLLRRLY